jgi:hypothetical protein
MSSLDSEVKVEKVSEDKEVKETVDSLDSVPEEKVDFSLYSEEFAFIPREYLVQADGRESYKLVHKFGDAELKDLTLKTKSGFLSTFVKEAFDKEKSTKEIPVPGGSKRHLEQLVRYLVHLDGIAGQVPSMPLTSKNMMDIVKDPWVAKWATDFDSIVMKENKEVDLPASRQFLYDTLSLADYLAINCAVHVLSARVAALIKGEAPEKLKGILKGTNEICPLEDDEKLDADEKDEKAEKKEEKSEEKKD